MVKRDSPYHRGNWHKPEPLDRRDFDRLFQDSDPQGLTAWAIEAEGICHYVKDEERRKSMTRPRALCGRIFSDFVWGSRAKLYCPTCQRRSKNL